VVHCPFVAEDVKLAVTDLEIVLETVVVDFWVKTVEEVEDFTLLLPIEDFTVPLVDDTMLPTLLLEWTLAHTNCVCPISHAPLMLNDSKRMLSIAFKFAPVKALSRTVYVCVDPVIPVKVVK
jgi:hypothetical protein